MNTRFRIATISFITALMGLSGPALLRAQTLQDAIRLTENEQFESAARVYEKLLTSEPSNGSNYYYYGENFFRNDHPEKAQAMYLKGTNVSPATALNYVGLGKILYNAGNNTDADADFFKAKTISKSKSADVLMAIADVYINADVKNIKEAINLLTQAAGLEPKNPDIYTLMGDAYLEQNDGNTAIIYYDKALDINKKFTKAILREGKLYSRAKNYNQALENYNKAIGIDSSFAPAFRERAELRFRAGQSERAAADYQKYLKLNDNISARTRYASFKFVSKDYKTAIDEISDIQKKDTSDINLFRLAGYAWYEMGKYPEALSNMEKFFRKAGSGSKKLLESDYEYLGKSQLKNGKDSLGTINLLQAIKMDNSKTDLYGDIASACMKSKNYRCAISNYEKKIFLSKDGLGGANDYYGLGRAYYFAKDSVKADSAFSQLVRLQPALPVGYLWLARCNMKFDPDSKKGLAEPWFLKFIEVTGTDIEKTRNDIIQAYEYLGYHNMLVKNYPKAKEAWMKLKEIDPENVKAKKALTDPNLK